MTCRDVQDQLSAHLDGELEADRAAEVDAHLGSCADCTADFEGLSALDGMLRESISLPADAAEREGRFDQMWAGIAAEWGESDTPSVLNPRPTPWQRLRAWWAAQPHQAWLPAMAAAAVLVVMIALVVNRTASDQAPGAGASPTPGTLAHAPSSELPPFAGPRIEPSAEPSVAAGGPEGSGGETIVRPAPRRRAPEEMVAHNEAFIVSCEVERGIVMIEQDPEEPDQPIVVWHLMPEDIGSNGESI